MIGAVVVVAIASAVVAIGSFGLSQADRNAKPTAPPVGSTQPLPSRPILSGDPATRSFLGRALPNQASDPLGPAPASPIWVVDGQWWAALLDPPTRATRLYRLAPDGAAWLDTGRVLDERPGAIVDTLWSGDHLYVVSAVPDRATSSAVRLTRYSPDAKSGFKPDPDFAVVLSDRGVRSVSIARDGTGRLWLATIAEDVLSVAHSTVADEVWGPGADVTGGVAAASSAAGLIVFGSGRLGLAWAEPTAQRVRFAWRSDGDPPETWQPPETALADVPLQRDPIDVVAGPADSVLVSVAGDVRATTTGSANSGRVMLARRSAEGTWASAVVGRVEDRHGPAAVVVDVASDEVDLVSRVETDGTFALKRSILDRLEFAAGRGQSIALPGGLGESPTVQLGSPHLPKGVPPESGYLVMAFDLKTQRYVYSLIGPSAGGPAPPEPAVQPPVTALPIDLVADTFDPWPAGAHQPAGWLARTGDPAAAITVVDAPGRGRVLRLVSTATSDSRACKDIGPFTTGRLTVTTVVRLAAMGTADATLLGVRFHGEESVLVRFGQGGTFAWYAGATKVRSSVAWRAGTWYRATATLDLDRRTYDIKVSIDGESRGLVAASKVPFRDPATKTAGSVCAQTSSGKAGLGLDVDRVVVTR